MLFQITYTLRGRTETERGTDTECRALADYLARVHRVRATVQRVTRRRPKR